MCGKPGKGRHTVQVTMPKPYIKYKIISSSRSWDICYAPLVKCQNIMFSGFIDMLMYGFSSTGVTIYCYYTPTHRVGAILQSPCLSVRSHFHNRYLSFYWKKWFYIWYMALAWWLVPCVSPFQVYRTSTSCCIITVYCDTCTRETIH
jgi:hypothetical protein